MAKIPLPPRNTQPGPGGSYDDRPKGGTPDGRGAKGGGKATKLTWIVAGIVVVVFVYAVVASL